MESIATVFILIAVAIIPLVIVLVYYLGLKTGILLGTKTEVINNVKSVKPEKLTKEEKAKVDASIKEFETVWENINNYTGDATNQKEVN